MKAVDSNLEKHLKRVVTAHDILQRFGQPLVDVQTWVETCHQITEGLRVILRERCEFPETFHSSICRKQMREFSARYPEVLGKGTSEYGSDQSRVSKVSKHSKKGKEATSAIMKNNTLSVNKAPSNSPKHSKRSSAFYSKSRVADWVNNVPHDTSSVASQSLKSDTSASANRSSASSQRAQAEAELAEKQARAQALVEEEEQQAKLVNLNAQIEMEKLRLTRMQAQNEVKAAEAKTRALADVGSIRRGQISGSHLNPQASAFIPRQRTSQSEKLQPMDTRPEGSSLDSNTEDIAEAIVRGMTRNRLPTPEPKVFKGDALEFVEWSMSFKQHIETKCVTTADKFFYLQRYVGGEAKSTIGGISYRQDEEAYQQAWSNLQSRYGHPFVQSRAYREKLNAWQKIGPKEALKLQEFADFLRACSDAIPHVSGLDVLNDYEQNRKLLTKLPDHIVLRWNRIVTEQLDANMPYPSFNQFASFITNEAKVACNPVSSLYALHRNDKSMTKEKRNEAKVLSIGATKQLKQNPDPIQNSKPNVQSDELKKTMMCHFCKGNHSLASCVPFKQSSLKDRKKFVQSNHLCFACLKVGHSSRVCRYKHTCGKCKGRHPTCLQDDDYVPKKREDSTKSESPDTSTVIEASQPATSMNSSTGGSELTSNVVPVWVSTTENPSFEKLTYAILDNQSDSTFIDETLCRELNPKTHPVQLKLTTMMGRDSEFYCLRASGLQVRAFHQGSHYIALPHAYTKEVIPLDREHIPCKSTAQRWPHLIHLAEEIPPLLDCDVGLLIGYNCSRALQPREVVSGQDSEPYAMLTDLGWSIMGNTSTFLNPEIRCYRVAVKEKPAVTPADAIRALEKDFSNATVADIKVSQDDITFLKVLEENIHTNEKGNYEMPLPFHERPHLPNNRATAKVRLNCLRRKLMNDQKYLKHYRQFMETIFQAGHAEIVNNEGRPGERWYLPHHGVYHPTKDKLRVVFDCSARHQGDALNDYLMSGHDLTNNLVGILLRFRKHPVAVLCDVEKMFHQFHVNLEDRDFFRFLWWENGDLDGDVIDCRMTVHLFGATSSPGCANFGIRSLASKYEQTHASAAAFIKRNFYVDDGITSVRTTAEAQTLITETRELCAKGNLNLHKFLSNNSDALIGLQQSKCASPERELNMDRENAATERALGLRWTTDADVLKFHLNATVQGSDTRRTMLSLVASLFDPLGFLAPFVLSGKRILQIMCKRGSQWDEEIPAELLPEWSLWTSCLKDLEGVRISRCYFQQEFGEPVTIQLHHFADASTKGYGACSYIRGINKEGKVHCTLVMAKTRVAPTKLTTIPRLELSAAVTAAQLSHFLRSELDLTIDAEYFWIDSKVVLGYVNNDSRRFHVFVANRVERIRQLTDPSNWQYVESHSNPADLASRGASVAELKKSIWFDGPPFLWQNEIPAKETPINIYLGDPEVRKVTSYKASVTHTSINWETQLKGVSSWKSALVGVARIIRISNGIRSNEPASVRERDNAEILKSTQRTVFETAYTQLSQPSAKLSYTSHLAQLEPFLENDLLRAGGRLKNAPLTDREKCPIILPRKGHVTWLIIKHHHEATNHQGRGITLNQIRQNGYWIIGGSKVVAKYIRQCFICRKSRRPPENQRMADLPKERLEQSAPFTFSGVDFLGSSQARKEIHEGLWCFIHVLLLSCNSH